MPEYVITVDLGATKILTGIGTADGRIVKREKMSTPGDCGNVLDCICHSIEKAISECSPEGKIRGIAVATPGPLSYPEAVVVDSPNLQWNRVPLRDELSRRLGRPVIVEKDTNMAVLGEYHYGCEGRCQNLIYITVSTGIGGGIILNDRLYRGRCGGAGEIGHMVIDPRGIKCGCGRKGCLEALASGTAIARTAAKLVKAGKGQGILDIASGRGEIKAEQVGEAARRGDCEAQGIIARIAEYLGTGIANLVNIFNPEAVILGGGVAWGWQELLLKPVSEFVRQEVFALNARDLEIRITSLGEDIVLYGCMAAVVLGAGIRTVPLPA
ncbi:MAG: ROK family protein [Syntrophomonas sp.]